MDNILEDFIKLIDNNYEKKEGFIIKKALYFAMKKHQGQFRKSGEPYIIHPIIVSTILTNINADANTISAALLHDTIEDTKTTYDEISKCFNEEIANMVLGVTKIKGLNYSQSTTDKNIYIRKVVTSILTDVRILIIKLVDRLHNMQTLEYQSKEKQIKIAKETLEIYVPLANHIGAYDIKFQLEDLSFKYLNNEKYNEIANLRNEIINNGNNILDEMIESIDEVIKNKNINCTYIKGSKNVYGIYKRINKGESLHNISDLLRIKIITDDMYECYYILGIIHNMYRPINGKFKDYISVPKSNHYQSLHTTIFAPLNEKVQIQIRTKEMNEIDTKGIMYYWEKNKDNAKYDMQKDLLTNFSFFYKLKEINEKYSNVDNFIEALYHEILKDKVYVYIGNGNIIDLPIGSSLSDVYEIIGDDSQLLVVNNCESSNNYVLKDGDRINVKRKIKTFKK